MRYSIEPRDICKRIYVKGYGFLSFAKSLSYEYRQKLLDSTKNFATEAIKRATKKQFKKPQKQLVT